MHDWQVQSREQLGLQIAALSKLGRKGGVWLVPSQSSAKRYTVCPDPTQPHCTCPDHAETGHKCKHIYAVEYVIRREQNADGSMSVTETLAVSRTTRIRPTYRQNWPAYNMAQTNEKREFQALLYQLCQNLPPIKRRRGRPPLPLSDAVFAVVSKIYSGMSQRRVITDLEEAAERGCLTKVPHYNCISNYLENSDLTPLLRDLIHRSSRPLQAVEVDFAVDSTGFTTRSYVRHYDQKYRGAKEHMWVKVHLMCGVKTNIVTAVEIKERDASDAVQLRPLLELTASHFNIAEVSADKAYAVVYNHEAIAKAGATAFIPFKSNHTGASGGVWEKAFHFFNLHRDEFLEHYHKRSNIESTIWMIKSKFDGFVRSKTETAMVNEVLCKVLAHNICCLVQSIYELGIAPQFFVDAEK